MAEVKELKLREPVKIAQGMPAMTDFNPVELMRDKNIQVVIKVSEHAVAIESEDRRFVVPFNNVRYIELVK